MCSLRHLNVCYWMSSRGRVESPVSTSSNDVIGISRWLRIRIRTFTGLSQESFNVLTGMSINSRYLHPVNTYPVNMLADRLKRCHGEKSAESNTELLRFGCQSTRGFWMRWKRLRMYMYRYISFIWEQTEIKIFLIGWFKKGSTVEVIRSAARNWAAVDGYVCTVSSLLCVLTVMQYWLCLKTLQQST